MLTISLEMSFRDLVMLTYQLGRELRDLDMLTNQSDMRLRDLDILTNQLDTKLRDLDMLTISKERREMSKEIRAGELETKKTPNGLLNVLNGYMLKKYCSQFLVSASSGIVALVTLSGFVLLQLLLHKLLLYSQQSLLKH